jgi:hypothetical protein
MEPFFSALGRRLDDPLRRTRAGEQKALSQCTCGQPIFFRNSVCLACEKPLGFDPSRGNMVTLVPGDDEGIWRVDGEPATGLRRCANFDTPAGCNWLLPEEDAETLCIACRLNRTIPDLSVPGNDLRWHQFEVAKRRLVAQLLALGLPVLPKAEDENSGLAFDFLGPDQEGKAPLTGHASGLITFNIAEADDAHREQVRVQMHEPYRTLLGHFRHEVGHYYWERLIRDTPWLEDFRKLFGDETLDYGQAVDRHYQEGPPADWQQGYVSAYATMHPWEDWAETWAHYLHMMDTLDTALSFGMRAADVELDFQPFTREALYDPQDPNAEAFLGFVNAWIELAAMLNELARSMGQHDLYPFVLPAPVIGKLQFIHKVVLQSAQPSPAEGAAT